MIVQQQSKAKRPPEQTFEEIRYLKKLIENHTRVVVKLTDNQTLVGVVGYYDQRFIRITRPDGPNLFIFKHDIKYLHEAE